MNPFVGKTMFVLGAGASRHTGAPLLFDFMSEARARMLKAELVYKKDFKDVFEWIEKMKGPAYYLNLDLNNLEHVFSLISMLNAVDPEGEKLYKSISLVMLETLEQCQVPFQGEQFQPDPVYTQFLVKIDEHANQLSEGVSILEQPEVDTIVTFNYDVMLNFAFYSGFAVMPNYCLKGENTKFYNKLVKLHGSMNWASHRRCPQNSKNEIQIVAPAPLPGSYSRARALKRNWDFRMLTEVLQKTQCKFCGKDGVLYPVFIPPTWAKKPEQIINVWKAAIDELRTTSQIVIIGYSLPPTDTFFQYILALGLFEGAQLERIIVIDPAASKNKDFKERYDKAFSRGLVERGKLKFKGETFQELLKGRRPPQGRPFSFQDVVYDLEYDDWD